MKKIGIVGGVAWPSTVEYYAGICRRLESRGADSHGSAPEMTIESLDHARAVAFLGVDDDEDSWRRFDEYHRAALRRLETSGADFGLIASVSPHHRLRSIVRGVSLRVLSIFDEAAGEASRLGAERVLMLGTALTMRSGELRAAFAARGIVAAGPRESATRERVVELLGELQRGAAVDMARRLQRIASEAVEAAASPTPVVCLCCTELPLAFEEHREQASFTLDGIQYVNTLAAHIEAACALASEDAATPPPS